MCLAVPLKIVERTEKEGIGEFDGACRTIRLDFVPEAGVGDYVMVHAGFAITVMRKEEAEADREAFREVAQALKDS
ncbi:MAG: HypC/HybG/HupF family hydrogenase formation chaperone [Eubacteriales bacterium]|nr:HypC/HybG/HupF family hydrogenase formation chaperone [Eubacteriales bacterium]